MKIIVTGGCGFLGSYLCERLLAKGDEVCAIDNLYTGTDQNVAHLIKNPKFSILYKDLVEFESADLECDQIFHFACPASPVHYQRNPLFTWKTGVFGTYHLLNLALKNKAQFLLASTSEVYGNPLVHPQTEDYWGNVNPVGPRSCYDESKRAAETITIDFARFCGLDTKIIRIFNTYGPRMDANDGRVVSNFITQAIQNKDITVYGNGEQTRSFCYVDDLTDGILAMMNKINFQGPVNLGNPNEFKVIELAEKILTNLKTRSKIIFKPLPVDDPKKRKPNISLAKKELGWEPKIQLEEGIQKTTTYFQKILCQ